MAMAKVGQIFSHLIKKYEFNGQIGPVAKRLDTMNFGLRIKMCRKICFSKEIVKQS